MALWHLQAMLICYLSVMSYSNFNSFQGIENIKNEIEDTSEPLIDPVYGHGR